MVGSVTASPVQTGQSQNAQLNQQAGQLEETRAERREPRADQVQARESPAAQSQETRAENTNRDREASNDGARGQVFDAVV